MKQREGNVIWLLKGARVGDNAQIANLGELLGATRVIKPLAFNFLHHLPNWLIGASTLTLTNMAKATLVPPWPDLAISAGKRSVPVARYIRRASRGKTRLVHVGRPRANLDAFDLVVTTPQYGLPPAPNVIELALSVAIPRPVPPDDMARWSTTWKDLPRPWIAVAIGAGKFPQRLGNAEIREIGQKLTQLASRLGGSIVAMASPRTERQIIATLKEQVRAPAKFYAFDKAENPYQAALALADRIVVTSDSMSMLSEAINSGRPVSVFKLPVSPLVPNWGARTAIAAWLARQGFLTPPRNMPAVVDRLLKEGYASLLGQESEQQAVLRPNYEAVLERIRQLLKG